MKYLHRSQTCRAHLWERRLEIHRGIEYVVRSCRYCMRRELCWSRRPISAEALNGAGIELIEEGRELLPTRIV
jgi:hypothetical protein